MKKACLVMLFILCAVGVAVGGGTNGWYIDKQYAAIADGQEYEDVYGVQVKGAVLVFFEDVEVDGEAFIVKHTVCGDWQMLEKMKVAGVIH